MSKVPSPPRDRFPVLLALAVGLCLLVLGVASLRSYQDLADQRRRETELETSIAETAHRIEALRERIQRLRDDPVTLERRAREELGWVFPGDVVMVFPEESDTVPGPGPAPAIPDQGATQSGSGTL